MEKNCETCRSYKRAPCFASDGVCFLIPSKPQFVKKTCQCKHWTQKEGDKK
jgi:hypothetical protein